MKKRVLLAVYFSGRYVGNDMSISACSVSFYIFVFG